MAEKNMDKYRTYKSMRINLSKAMKAEFYYQAIFIEYAIIEDRCTSLLKYANIKYIDRKGYELKLAEKLNKLKSNPKFTNAYVRKRITLKLIEELTTWKRERDKLIHSLAKIPYDAQEVKMIAEEGYRLVSVLTNKVQSVNRHNIKLNNNITESSLD